MTTKHLLTNVPLIKKKKVLKNVILPSLFWAAGRVGVYTLEVRVVTMLSILRKHWMYNYKYL
jgi:hypothetical protein